VKVDDDISGYRYQDPDLNESGRLLLPAVIDIVRNQYAESRDVRIFEVGCGNGSVAHSLAALGYHMMGVYPSAEGVAMANRCYPGLRLYKGSAYDDLAAQYGQFPVVISLEVIEHVFFPRRFANTLFRLVEEGGIAIVSTPYHGYMKNLALAASGKLDDHFTALWDYGHIKFWSVRTLSGLLRECGFRSVQIKRVGRIPLFAKSMIAIARK
jgi:2-polyprenyl-6-hydroxyphenyl methylase/3-demethylubiquinone-9 3-methyltransferase